MNIPFCKIKFNEELKKHSSFRIGGLCRVFVIPENEEGLKNIIHSIPMLENHFISDIAKNKETNQSVNKIRSFFVIGNGTKILFNDFQNIIIKISEPYFSNIEMKKNNGKVKIKVGAGISICNLLKFVKEKALTGLEFMAGIPGTVGGAIAMNAGAFGKSISEVIEKIKIINNEGKIYYINKKEANFGYRKSRFSPDTIFNNIESKEIIIEAEIKLNYGDKEKIEKKFDEILKLREEKFPLNYPSCGCVFKNPTNISAATLIEEAGCKGLKIGDAQVSYKHANFIINLGNATPENVKTLIKEVQVQVYKKFNIKLEPELIIL